MLFKDQSNADKRRLFEMLVLNITYNENFWGGANFQYFTPAATADVKSFHEKALSIRPSSAAYPGPCCEGSSLSCEAQTHLSPATSSSSPWGREPKCDQASWGI